MSVYTAIIPYFEQDGIGIASLGVIDNGCPEYSNLIQYISGNNEVSTPDNFLITWKQGETPKLMPNECCYGGQLTSIMLSHFLLFFWENRYSLGFSYSIFAQLLEIEFAKPSTYKVAFWWS